MGCLRWRYKCACIFFKTTCKSSAPLAACKGSPDNFRSSVDKAPLPMPARKLKGELENLPCAFFSVDHCCMWRMIINGLLGIRGKSFAVGRREVARRQMKGLTHKPHDAGRAKERESRGRHPRKVKKLATLKPNSICYNLSSKPHACPY